MQFNVAQLLKEPVGSVRKYALDEHFSPLESTSIGWVRGEVAFTRTDKGVWAHGSLQSATECSCSRCLKGFWSPLFLRFDEEYHATTDVATGAPLSTPEPAEGFFTLSHDHILDLAEAVRQYAIANQPMKPLCLEDCKGLCPQCGANLNEGTCHCPMTTQGHPWREVLKVLAAKRG